MEVLQLRDVNGVATRNGTTLRHSQTSRLEATHKHGVFPFRHLSAVM